MATALRGCRILVVEDNFLLAETLRDFLEDCGCETVGPAPRVSVALPLCDDGLDGAMLDINLGQETCFEVADLLTERGIPFMFLSGYDDAALIPERFSAIPKLGKPYNRDEIMRAAERHFLRG